MKKILMVGPGRDVMGGITTVVNSYYKCGIDKNIKLKYIESMKDGSSLKKFFIAVKAFIVFCICLNNYDIVHIHMAAYASFTRKSIFIRQAKRHNKIVIIHQHAGDFDEYFLKKLNDKERMNVKKIFSISDKLIVLSEEWASFFGKNVCDQEKIIVIHNGVILPDYEKNIYSDHNVLFLGRLEERKEIYDLLKAICKVIKCVPDAMFYLGGDGKIEKFRHLAEDLGILKNVCFLGWVRDEEKINYLKKCSVFVLPSYHEGMPMSVLEAMSYGLAAISTNAGGIPQIIDNEINGIRIDAGNVDVLAENLINLLSDKNQKEKLGRFGRKKIAEEFDIHKNIELLCKLYSELIQ